MDKKILDIRSLKKYYGKGENLTRAVDGISFYVLPGEFIGIMGPSGSGKTTLLNCIASIVRPTEGEIYLEGVNIAAFNEKQQMEYRGKKMGYLFQDFKLLDNLTGRENILMPAAIHGMKKQESEKRIRRITEYLGLNRILDKYPYQMSGGERQRIAAARALILNPSVILADEPTGALDSKNARALLEELKKLNDEQKRTILMVTHNPDAASFCSRILILKDGVIFHELRRKQDTETRQEFYERITDVMAAAGRRRSECSLNLSEKRQKDTAGKRDLLCVPYRLHHCVLYLPLLRESGCHRVS